MFFFEGKIELYQILFLLIIPVGIPVFVFFIRRKLLWFSPLLALLLGLALTTVFYPYYFTDIFTSNVDTTSGFWLMLVLPAHCITSVIATAVCYAITRLRKRRG